MVRYSNLSFHIIHKNDQSMKLKTVKTANALTIFIIKFHILLRSSQVYETQAVNVR